MAARAPGIAVAAAPCLVTLLGPVRIADAAPPRTRKARALLALLALDGSVSRQRLADLLWSDRADEQARASVRQAVYELRQLLGPDAVRSVGEEIALDGARVTSDLAAITRLTDPTAVLASLEDASPDVLAGLDGIGPEFDDWLRDARWRLAGQIAAAARQAGEAALADAPETARRLAELALRFDRYDEAALRLALHADARLGDDARLQRRFRDFERRLADELDAAPARDTRAVRARLRDPAAAPALANDAEVGKTRTASSGPALHVRWIAAAVLLLLAALAAAWWRGREVLPPQPLIAVLPFTDLSPRSDRYFAGGLAEEVQNLLARAPGIGVLGRASAAEFGRGGNLLVAARALNVTHLLDGSVRARGDRVLVIVRLVRTRDGRQLWSDRYDRDSKDVFALQREIAGGIARRFTRAAPSRGTTPATPLPAVYDRYLSARALMRDRRVVPLEMAERALRDAIRQQPDYAAPHALLAQVLMLEARHPTSYGTVPYARARAEAGREAALAVRLDPTLGEAHAALGLLTYSNGASLPHYRRAVRLDPQRADFHRWLGQALLAAGRDDEGVRALARAVAIDPLWGLNSEHLVVALIRAGRGAEAAAVVRRFTLLSRDVTAKARLAIIYAEGEGRLADAYRAAERHARLAPDERQSRFRLASAAAALGARDVALRAIAADDWSGRAALLDQTDRLASAAATGDAALWDTAIDFWGIADRLVASGHGQALLALFRRRFGSIDGYRPGEIIDVAATAPIIAALRQTGRDAEGAALLQRLVRQLAADPRARKGSAGYFGDRAIVAALTGRREEAQRLFAIAARREPALLTGVPYRPLAANAALRGLALDASDATLRTFIDAERRKLGWPPLPR